jgi:hypothetical protein
MRTSLRTLASLSLAGVMSVGYFAAASATASLDMQLIDAVRRGDREAARQMIKSDPAAVNRAAAAVVGRLPKS